jgi:glutamate 5-kinase
LRNLKRKLSLLRDRPGDARLPDMKLDSAARIVIKIGSSLIAEEGQVRRAWLEAFAADVATLTQTGKEIILVSSGAVALGRGVLGLGSGTIDLEEKQAAAAAGQPLLMQAWQQAFAPYSIGVAQMLLTLEDSEDRARYLNARATCNALLAHRLIPIVNENDTVATAEIKVGDNDRLAARVAGMVSADVLILLSDVDGLYTADPRQHPDATHIPEVTALTPDILAMAGVAASSVSSGGMKTKLDAAAMAMSAGCNMVIAKGSALHALKSLHEGARATWFLSATRPLMARKHWIATSMQTSGTLVIDEGAERALTQGKSLLPAGVLKVDGRFDRGDTVVVKNMTGTLIARGIVAYSVDEATRIIGKKSDAIAGILGYEGKDTLIHRDDLALV